MSAPYIPATALSGGLLAPCLPVTMEWHADDDPPRWVSGVITAIEEARDGTRVIWYSTDPYIGFDNRSPVFLRLDPRRPEVAHRIADLLRSKGHEAGHLLPVALGGRQGDVTAYEPCERCESAGGTCYRCREGSEMDRPPRRTIPAADVSAVLLAASVAGVELGRGVVRGVLGEWRKVRNDDPDTGATWVRHRLFDSHNEASGLWVCSKLQAWRTLGWQNSCESGVNTIWQEGPETGPEGRVAADAAASRLGYALLDPASPFGVVAPTFDLENR